MKGVDSPIDKAAGSCRAACSPGAQPTRLVVPASRKAGSVKSAWRAPEKPISIRFEPEMLERLDRVASQLSKINTKIRIGRSSVVKLATERALATIEAELSIASA